MVLKRVAQKHPAYGIFMPRYVTVSQDMESIHVVLSTKQDSDNITIKPYAVRNFSDSAMIDLLFEMVNFDSFFEEGGDILSEVDDISQWFYYESISWCGPVFSCVCLGLEASKIRSHNTFMPQQLNLVYMVGLKMPT